MSAEAERLDREAQQLEDEARSLDAVAPQVEADGSAITDTASRLRAPFLQAVGSAWIGPHADKFLHLAQTRYERLSRNEGNMREVAANMRRAANNKRDEARRKRDRANQLRREEEERRRKSSW